MIELSNVTKSYGKKQNVFTAIDDVSLSISDATSVSITGKSGSGKSTLMHIMSGLDRPTSGEIIIDGKSLHSMSRKNMDSFRATQMSFIFQAFFVEANQTCLDNVLLPLEIAGVPSGNRKKLARRALKSVELEDKINVKAKNLSGGQKQRLAIARAIVNKPKIIFADEPTGNLDTATGNLVTQLLFDLNAKMKSILVIVTHDEDLAKQCTQRIVLKDGKLIKNTIDKKTGKKK